MEKARFRKEQDAEGEHVAAEESTRSQEVRRLSRDAINRAALKAPNYARAINIFYYGVINIYLRVESMRVHEGIPYLAGLSSITSRGI